jgi:predicted ATPase
MIAEGDPGELVGREADLLTVRSFADRVGEGNGGALVVVGEYGVGKSSLTRALASHPAVEVVDARAEPGEFGLDLAERVLATRVPGSAHRGRRRDGGLVAAAEVALEAITKRAARGPVVWVVDDLDLADRSARTFMGYVARRIAHLPAGMVLTGWRRGEPLPAGAEVVRLHPLPHQATAHLVRAKLGED